MVLFIKSEIKPCIPSVYPGMSENNKKLKVFSAPNIQGILIKYTNIYPNVNIITEMTNMIDASRAYEANATAFNASKSMALQGLELNG